MKCLIILSVLLVGGLAARSQLDNAWATWQVKYDQTYETDVEAAVRRGIWEAKFDDVAFHNIEASLGLHTYTQALNQFGDRTMEEYRANLGYVKAIAENREVETTEDGLSTPSTKDWRTSGMVTSVKNQESCGSCWAFATAASSESSCAIKYGSKTLTSFSTQQLVSCDKQSSGCNGGLHETGFHYYIKHGAITWANYPYTSGTHGNTGSCKASGKPIYAYLASWKPTTSGSESSLENAVGNYGPAAVAIDASQNSFANYQSGIYYSSRCSSKNLDHEVTVVGYNQNSQGQYWIVKNSWGAGWGLSGYVWMAKNRNNNCGICTEAGYPKCGSLE